MKKKSLLLILLILLTLPASTHGKQAGIIINIEGNTLDTKGISAYIEEGTTFVPLRAISENLDYKVSWNNESRTVFLEKDDLNIKLSIGNLNADVNGRRMVLSQAPRIKNEITFLPIRFLSEMIDYEVDYERKGNINIIDINMPQVENPSNTPKFTPDPSADIYKDIRRINNMDSKLSYRYFFDYPELDKVLGMELEEDIRMDLITKYTYFNPSPSANEAISYETFIEKTNNPDEIKVKYEFDFHPLGKKSTSALYHTYKWSRNGWELIDASIENYEKSPFFTMEWIYSNPSKAASLYQKGNLHIKKDNIRDIFFASENEITRILGDPDKFDVLNNFKMHDYYYDGFVVRYHGGNNKNPWGPTQINFENGKNTVLGIKVGDPLKNLETILGNPETSFYSYDTGNYFMVYSFDDFTFYFYASDENSPIKGIYVKEF